jgi:hypothetical protein
MNNVFCFVTARWYKSLVLAGFKDLHCIWVCIPTAISHSNECIIQILILCDISTLIVHLVTLQFYIQFFLQKALISIWMLSLPTHHWLCIITSWTFLQHVSTAPANTWYHYLLVLLPSKSCYHGKREVPWLWQVVHLDWTTPDVPQSLSVSDGGTCLPAETCCQMPQLQQWLGPLNRNNSCCFRPWGWWWYVYWHVYQRHQEATMHWARRWQSIQRNLWRHWCCWWFWSHDTKSLRWCWSNLWFTNCKLLHMAIMVCLWLWQSHCLPPQHSSSQASNKTLPLGTAISLPVDDVLARMSPNTPVEDALLDFTSCSWKPDHCYTSLMKL